MMDRKSEIQNRTGTTGYGKSGFRSYRWMIGMAFGICALFWVSFSAFSAEKNEGNINDTRASLERWVETKRIISQEKRDLKLAKEMLKERIDLVQHEIHSMHGKIGDAKKSINEADQKRADMMAENDKLKEASTALSTSLISLENRTQQLLPQLPVPLQERIKPLSQRLPENGESTKLSVPERFQNVVGILNEVDKFNRDILVTSEVRKLEDGSSLEVTALYLGIGQSYYTSTDGKIAGTGIPTGTGWVWKEKNEAAPHIAEAIAILKNEKVASFVQIPVEIR